MNVPLWYTTLEKRGFMKITVNQKGDSLVAIIHTSNVEVNSVQDALDLVMTLSYVHRCNKMILPKQALPASFFDLKTKFAGEVLQKFTNYKMQVAIIGEFNAYSSKSLQDFIRECNRGSSVFFLPDEETALKRLHAL